MYPSRCWPMSLEAESSRANQRADLTSAPLLGRGLGAHVRRRPLAFQCGAGANSSPPNPCSAQAIQTDSGLEKAEKAEERAKPGVFGDRLRRGLSLFCGLFPPPHPTRLLTPERPQWETPQGWQVRELRERGRREPWCKEWARDRARRGGRVQRAEGP